MIEPFGYFRAEPFGWTDCSEADEGAVPLYEQASIDELIKQRDDLMAELNGIKENLVIAATCNHIARMEQAEKQRDDLLAALQSISNITGYAGFNIGGPLEFCPGELPADEAKRLLSLACEYLKEISKEASRAIDRVKGEPCTHAREIEQRTGDGTLVMFCPDCGRNEAQPARFSSDDTSAPAIVFYPAGSLGESVESEGGEA